MFSYEQLDIIEFCAIECQLQMSGEESVGWMTHAWQWASGVCINALPTPTYIQRLGCLVEPQKNAKGFRHTGVSVGWDVKGDWRDVPRQIDNLCDAAGTTEPAEWFRIYEEIHPFVDGNGRSGVILFNWLNGTLNKPVWPPDFWGDPRRMPGYGAPLDRQDAGR